MLFRSELVRLVVEPGQDPAEGTTQLLRTLLDEGAKVVEVRRGESLERRYFAAEEGR